MGDSLYFILISFSIVFIAYLFLKKEKGGIGDLREELKEIQNELRDSREKSFESLQGQLNESNRIVREVTSELEKIHSDHKNVIDVRNQLGKLSDILSNPKQRGILGEYFLENLLKNVFQPHQYKCQYSFKDGETVDAIIFVKDKIIPIDAKFSLVNYNKILEEDDEGRRESLEKTFRQDLKYRIEETSKYIRPNEGTMDFAFMFIPSEGIYYDLLINKIGGVKSNTSDLIEYAFKDKHVIVVSPTSFYAYLQTVLQGLRALRIEESAKNVIKNVESLQKNLSNYESFLKKLGDSLSTTVNSYNKSYKEFAKIDKDIVKLTKKKDQIKSLEVEKPDHKS
jgi:DNA recombination protein RmuC